MVPARRVARPIRSLIIALAGITALLLVSATGSFAAPDPSAVEVATQLDSLELKMERATEDYDRAQEQLGRSEARTTDLRSQANAQREKIAEHRRVVEEFAADAYQSGPVSQFTSLLKSGSPQNFLDQMTTLDHLSKDQREQLDQLVAAQETLDGQLHQLAAEVAKQKTHTAELKSRKAAIEADLGTWRKLSVKVNQPQQTAPARTDVAQGSGRQPSEAATYTGPASGRAATAVKTAYAQLGKPYQWAADGPGSFDCSGLTLYAWAAAGVSLPHSSQMQYSAGQRVARAELQPGDLVFFGSPISHVALYIGGNRMISAPTEGQNVKILTIDVMAAEKPYVGAVRP